VSTKVRAIQFDSIETLVEDRNEFVHTGRMNFKLFDAELQKALADFEAGVNRAYESVANHYGFFHSNLSKIYGEFSPKLAKALPEALQLI
jgi:hypothetical protein